MVIRSRRVTRNLLVAALIGSLATIHTGVAYAEPTIDTLEDELAASTAELDVIVEDYNRLTDEITEVEQRHDDLVTTVDRLRDDLAVVEQEVGHIAEALYRSGNITPLFTGSPDALADRLSLLDYIGGHRQQSLARLDDAQQSLDDEQRVLDDMTDRRAMLRDARSDKEAEIVEAVAQLDRARTAAVNAGYGFDPSLQPPPVPGGEAGAAAAALQFAHDALGAPYQWGGTGPGYDCSGLTSAAWAAAGVHLPHSTHAQYDAVARIGADQLQPGDLVFYYDDLRHVAVYVGDGKIIHAPTSGQTVQVAPVDQMPVYGYGRPR